MCLALPGKIIEIITPTSEDLSCKELSSSDQPVLYQRVAKVDFGGVIKLINLAFLEEAQIGQYILAHVGVALSVIDEEEAQKTIEAHRLIQEESDELS